MVSYKRKKRVRQRKTRRNKNKELMFFVGGDDKCIYVPLHDGLGNQLFIYAAALVAKKKLGMPLCIMGATSGEGRDYRPILFTNSVAVDSSDSATKERMSKSTTILRGLASAHQNWVNSNIVANTSKNVILSSTYFQNYKAIEKIIPEMREQIMGALEKAYPEFKATIDSATSGFMHVRRGNYDKTFGQALPKEYYQNGLNEISASKTLKTIYVMSNDLDWCKAQGFTVPESIQLKMYDEPDELKTFYALCLCTQAAVMSASTYSTWGAILGAHANDSSIIIYPKVWFMAPNSSVLRFPERWKAI